jgi:hypothetical protein
MDDPQLLQMKNLGQLPEEMVGRFFDSPQVLLAEQLRLELGYQGFQAFQLLNDIQLDGLPSHKFMDFQNGLKAILQAELPLPGFQRNI